MQLLDSRSAAGQAFPDGVLRVEYASSVDGHRDWALLWPRDGSRTWAVVLHGHGSHGDQLYSRPDIRRAWLDGLRSLGLGILTPNLRDDSWMGPAAVSDLDDLLAWLRVERRAERFVFLSGSMGGTGNLVYAALRPRDAAAVVALGAVADLAAYRRWCAASDRPILSEIGAAIERAYGGPPEGPAASAYRSHDVLRLARRLCMPVFLAHGERDALMPVAQSRALAAAMEGRPGFCYREVAGGSHDAPLFLEEPFAWLARLQPQRSTGFGGAGGSEASVTPTGGPAPGEGRSPRRCRPRSAAG